MKINKKKILQPTLGKKIFIILMLSFCLVNMINVSLDYNREKYHAFENLNNSYLNALAYHISSDFQTKYETLDEPFFQDIQESLMNGEDEYTKHALILDNDLNVIYDQQAIKKPTLYLTQFQPYLEMENHIVYAFSLETMDTKTLEELEKTLKEVFHENTLSIDIASSTYTSQKENQKSFEINDITYLCINSHIFIDNKEENQEIESLYFDSYKSLNMMMSISKFYPGGEMGTHFLDIQEIKKNVIDSLQPLIPERNHYLSSVENQFEKDKTLYMITGQPLIKKGAIVNEYGEYNKDDCLGYIVFYDYDYQAIDRIMDTVIKSKVPIYGTSLIACFIISMILSYLLTKKIKKIDQSMLAIANNQFDIYLDESSNDELGTLSHNINHMSQQLKQTIDQLSNEIDHVKQLESVRKEFIANFTHEIKTPLGIINGYIELIEVTDDEDKKQEYLKAINQETDHINELVLAMLELSRLESGHVELKRQDIDLEDMLSTIIEEFAPLLEKKQIQISMEGNFPHIEADVQEMQIVFKNFISNAIKHTSVEGHIYILYHNDLLSFENEGEHLSDKQKEKIWDTYVSSDREGTGLGLAICKTILDLHGFSYDVQNTERGVSFQIKIGV